MTIKIGIQIIANAVKKSLFCHLWLISSWLCLGGGRPYCRQICGRQRGLGRVASGASRAAADPWPIAGHRARMSGMLEVDYCRLGGDVRTVWLADVLGQQVFGRWMAQGRMWLDRVAKETEGECEILYLTWWTHFIIQSVGLGKTTEIYHFVIRNKFVDNISHFLFCT